MSKGKRFREPILHRAKMRFRDLRIQSKIMVLFIPLVLLPLLLIGLLINYLFSQKLLEKSIADISDNSELVIRQVERTIENAGNCANMLTIQISRTILAQQENPYGYLSRDNALNGEISRASVVFPEVESIAFIDREEHITSPNAWVSSSQRSVFLANVLRAIKASNGVTLWFPMDYRSVLVADPGQVYLTLGKKVIDIQTGQQLGSLFLSVKESQFSKVLTGLGEENKSIYLIVDANDRIISSSDPSRRMTVINDSNLRNTLKAMKNGSQIISVEGKEQLVTSKGFNKIEWKLVTLTPVEAIYAEIWQVGRVIVVTDMFVALLALLMSQGLARNLARPIKELKTAIELVEGGALDTPIVNESKDEIGTLTRSFDNMRREVQSLIWQVNEDEAQKRHYEMSLIAAQIKPHFLYNTLDTIYVLAQMKRMEQVSLATKSLADFYRIALSDGAEEIELFMEFKHIEDYLKIQQIRYSDVFSYQIDLPEALGHQRIPKMTLQPIVENAIYHGLKSVRRLGQLTVRAEIALEGIFIWVEDNGSGMDAALMSEVLKHPEERSHSGHFGLYSVHRRLQLHYGPRFGISLRSQKEEGTAVSIHIPYTLID